MTFVGKVLVIVQVVLSLCFMAFAGAVFTVQQDWKDAHDQKVEDLANKNQELNEKEEEIALLNKDLAASQSIQNDVAEYLAEFGDINSHIEDDGIKTQLRVLAQRAEAAENEARNYKQQRDAREKELMEEQVKTDRLRIQNEYALREAKERAEEAEKLKNTTRDLNNQMAQANDRIFTLEEELFNRETEARGMAVKHKSLLSKVAELQKVLLIEGIDEKEALEKEEPAPLVRGRVYDTREPGRTGGVELVEISIGSDDGLSNGHELDIYRLENGGEYVGRMRIVKVTSDRAVGSVIQKSKNGVIQRGDYVTTQL